MDCVILTSGKATRLYPLTINTPKVLLPLGAKVILDDMMAKLTSLGFINRFIISVANEQVATYFKESTTLSKLDNVTFVEEPNAIGVINTLALIKPHLQSKQFLLIFPDELFINEVKNLTVMYQNALQTPISVGVKKMNKKVIGSYSRLEFNKKIVTKVIEKPQDKKAGFSTIGRYILPSDGLNYIDSNEQKSISDLINAIIDHGNKLSFNLFKGKRFDTGSHPGYAAAVKYFK